MTCAALGHSDVAAAGLQEGGMGAAAAFELTVGDDEQLAEHGQRD
ncbi:MAG: hypothetical protein ACRDSN_04195 [Pseudonocardiaceae bacterium]